TQAGVVARRIAQDPRVSNRFAGQQTPAPLPKNLGIPSGMTVVLVGKDGKPIAGNPPPGAAWKSRAIYHDAKGKKVGEVDVYMPLGPALLAKITDNTEWPENVEIALVAGNTALATTNHVTGPVTGLKAGGGSANVAGTPVRAHSVLIPVGKGGPAYAVATYPESTLSNAIDSQRLRILVPLLLLGLVLVGGAIFAADRISRALTELAGRADPRPHRRRRADPARRHHRRDLDRADLAHGRARGRARPLQGDAAALRRDARRHPRPERARGRRPRHGRAGDPRPRRPVAAVRRRAGRGDRAGPHRHRPRDALRPARGGRRRRRPRGRGARDARAARQPGAARGAGHADPARAPPARPGDGRRPGGGRLLGRGRRGALGARRAGRSGDRERPPPPGRRAPGRDRLAHRTC